MPLEMYPFLPSTVGHEGVRVILGKKSGRDSILYVTEKSEMKVDGQTVDELLQSVKERAITNKRPLTEEEFLALAREVAK